MKEFIVLEDVKSNPIAKLTISRQQYEEMSDSDLENQIDKFFLIVGIKSYVLVSNKDITVKNKEDDVKITIEHDNNDNWSELIVIIARIHKEYVVADTEKIIDLGLEDFEW